ncbi:MAG: 2-oxo acid dehydrogenase subunit E2 [Faecalibacterium sp.]|nr:2-oxo acid dehydrogenase subunit E2 [Ruminococcus sp.]MCM1392693.1 2-oxo acid dehydrogenase subunit E2 [Ruminococcus sp.]MCM1486380.1 2-oxo acid dehydrogenase subunit E2 [Faecalibacterium sp.]
MRITKREHFGIQRKMVSHITTESWRKIPHVTYMYEPDVTAFLEEYKKLNEGRTKEDKITINTLMLKTICEGLKAAPIMNSHLDFNRDFVTGKIDTFDNINISMPTILPNGEMMTINLRDFGARSLEDMTAYIDDVRRRAKKTNLTEAMYSVSFDNTIKGLKSGHILRTVMKLVGANFGHCKIDHLHGKEKKAYEAIPETERLTIKDLEQGTVTISNIGSTYRNQHGAIALLDIVPPQVTAFGIGAVQSKPIVVNVNGKEEVAIRKILPICIAFDHRALDFGDTIPFLERLDEIFEEPSVIHSWVNFDKKTQINMTEQGLKQA